MPWGTFDFLQKQISFDYILRTKTVWESRKADPGQKGVLSENSVLLRVYFLIPQEGEEAYDVVCSLLFLQ